MKTTFGAFKVIEEAGELLQVLGKVGAFPGGRHPDGGPPLHERAEDEAGDLLAAVAYLIEKNGLNATRVERRREKKLALFHHWGLTALDGTTPEIPACTCKPHQTYHQPPCPRFCYYADPVPRRAESTRDSCTPEKP